MNNTPAWMVKWNEKMEAAKPGLDAAGSVVGKVWNVIWTVLLWCFRLRAVFLAIPVVVAALKLARINYELLPAMVGLHLLDNGSFAFVVTKNVAVYGPLAVTALCLLMMALSRKTIYPWIISIFSLAIPLLILVINVFPG